MELITHLGYGIDPIRGLVYGKRGRPLRKRMNGYVWVMSHRNGKCKNISAAHRLIWEAAVGPIPIGLEINHINGVKHDNRLSNLEVVTSSGNRLHAYRTGLTSAKGERNGRAILTPDIVIVIRKSTETATKLAARYGVSRRTIENARSGRRWGEVIDSLAISAATGQTP